MTIALQAGSFFGDTTSVRIGDAVLSEVRHANGRTIGIMWHPERLNPFARRDIQLFQSFFGVH